MLTDPAHTPATLAACDRARAAGADVRTGPDGWLVVPAGAGPRPVDAVDPTVRPVAPDLAVAAGFLAAAALTTGTVVVRTWPAHDPAGDRVRAVLADLGTYVVRTAEGLTCTSRSTSGELTGVRADLRGLPGPVPVLVVLAALADGRSELRVGDVPEVTAVLAAVTAVGGRVRREGDVLIVDPGPPTGGSWPTAGSAAVAMAGAVLGLRVPGLVVDDLAPLTAVVPGFTDLWLRLLWADEHLLPGTSSGGEEPRH
nr:hypothetical protein [Nakamurella flavida]